MTNFQIETLHEKITSITETFCNGMSEAAIFCLDSQSHKSGVIIDTKTDNSNLELSVMWDKEINSQMHKTYKDENRTTDWGAMCISVFLATKLTEYTDFETSAKGDGVDFWLSKSDELEFSARLEISGIRKESKTNSIENRLTYKKSQTEQSDSTKLPAYVSIIEFSNPKAIFVKK